MGSRKARAGKAPRKARAARRSRAKSKGIDWRAVRADLEERGYAQLPGLLGARECDALMRLYAEPHHFRKRVDLARHGFGACGDYQYFTEPLPPLVAELRKTLYPPLARIANTWWEAWGRSERFPDSLDAFRARCAERGQTLPTPLLLRYGAGGYNRLHQDLYGEVSFPFQVTLLLSRPERDFRGGEFLLLEQRARMQTRGEAVRLARGEAIVFPTRERPLRGVRGMARAQLRHGASRVHRGQRFALGIIFHDARS